MIRLCLFFRKHLGGVVVIAVACVVGVLVIALQNNQLAVVSQETFSAVLGILSLGVWIIPIIGLPVGVGG